MAIKIPVHPDRVAAPRRRCTRISIVPTIATCVAIGLTDPLAAQLPVRQDSSVAAARDTTRALRFCFRGQPLPRCRSFAVFELGMATRLAGTVHEIPYTDASGATLSSRDPDAHGYTALELGWMTNQDSARAAGLTIRMATGDGASLAIKARRRRWLANSRTLDLSAGPVIGIVKHSTSTSFQRSTGRGLTAEVTYGFRDAGAVSLGGDAMYGGGRTVATVHAGARLGSHLAAITSAFLIAFGLWMMASMSGGI